MSLHVFANVVTPYGTASNNRGETEGNTTTLQKMIWQGQPHTTVSAEAIRFALRRLLASDSPEAMNRTWDEETRRNDWKEADFKDWLAGGSKFIDDDLLGFMAAEAAAEDSSDGKGKATIRRAVLEVTRAVSLTPWSGDVVFNAASPRATASAAKGEGDNPVPYMAEVHATRYQYGLAMTPKELRQPERAVTALQAIGGLGRVAGNQARFLFDFSPEAIILRITDDPAPRLLYCFDTADKGKTVGANTIVRRIELNDIDQAELIVGVSDLHSPLADQMKTAGVTQVTGVKQAVAAACERMKQHPDLKGA